LVWAKRKFLYGKFYKRNYFNALKDGRIEKIKTSVDFIADELFGLFNELVDFAIRLINDDTVF